MSFRRLAERVSTRLETGLRRIGERIVFGSFGARHSRGFFENVIVSNAATGTGSGAAETVVAGRREAARVTVPCGHVSEVDPAVTRVCQIEVARLCVGVV